MPRIDSTSTMSCCVAGYSTVGNCSVTIIQVESTAPWSKVTAYRTVGEDWVAVFAEDSATASNPAPPAGVATDCTIDYCWAAGGLTVDSATMAISRIANSRTVGDCRAAVIAGDSTARVRPVAAYSAVCNKGVAISAVDSAAEGADTVTPWTFVVGYSAVGYYRVAAGVAIDSTAEVGCVLGYRTVRNRWAAVIGATDSPATVIAPIACYSAVDNRRAAMVAVDSTTAEFFAVCNGETIQH